LPLFATTITEVRNLVATQKGGKAADFCYQICEFIYCSIFFGIKSPVLPLESGSKKISAPKDFEDIAKTNVRGTFWYTLYFNYPKFIRQSHL
jgi:hypothetical protein